MDEYVSTCEDVGDNSAKNKAACMKLSAHCSLDTYIKRNLNMLSEGSK